jgi:uncharacterized protein (TIGR02246 family)
MTETDAGVHDLYRRLIDAWNGRRPDEYAALFADEGAIVGFDGSTAAGRTEIARHLGDVFGDHPTARYVTKVRATHALGPDGAVLRAIAGMVPPGQRRLNPELNAVQCLTAERDGSDWRIVLFQNTPAQYHGRPHLGEEHTAELEALTPAT